VGLIAAFVPIWGLTAAGYFARRQGVLADNAAAVLGQFVFHLAIPADLFLTLDRTSLARLAGRPLAAFAVSTVVIMITGWFLAWRWFDRKPGERAIWSMAAGYVNSANLGIPIATQVLGSASFVIEVLLMQTLVVTPVVLILLDRYDDTAGAQAGRATGQTPGRAWVRRLASLPVRNPVIAASALGLLASATRFRPPPVVHAPLALLGAAAVPTALVALGTSLYRQAAPATAAESPSLAEITVITVLKLIAQPAVAFVVGAFVLSLDHADLVALVVCAGLPTAQNAFIYAQNYHAGAAVANRAILVTSTLSMGTLLTLVAVVGRRLLYRLS
jgi:malonate transporter and related proteins